jgi:hypothetical protein
MILEQNLLDRLLEFLNDEDYVACIISLEFTSLDHFNPDSGTTRLFSFLTIDFRAHVEKIRRIKDRCVSSLGLWHVNLPKPTFH